MADWSPVKIEEIINETANRIEKGVLKVDEAYREFLEADLDFDVAEAKDYLRLEGHPAHERRYHTVLNTIDQRRRRDLAEARYKLCDKNIKALERKLDAYRSIGTSVRQAYAVAGTGER